VGGADGLVGGETSYGNHHLSTDDSGHPRAGATPMNGGRPSLHRQIPTQVLADGQAPTSAWRRHAGVRTRQSKNTNAALAACDVLDGPPVRMAQQPPVRWADNHTSPQRWEVAPEAAPEPLRLGSQTRGSCQLHGRRTPLSPDHRGKERAAAHVETGPDLPRPPP
jgi:hypothetical protein